MSRQSLRPCPMCATVLVAAVVLCCSAWGMIDFTEEARFVVPGLTGAIEQADLKDVDGDGYPEVLVCDGATVVLFSLARAEVLFATQLDPAYLASPHNCLALLADVTRDHVGDVVVASSSSSGDWGTRIFAYDGGQGFEGTCIKQWQTACGGFGDCVCVRTLAAVDTDDDGYGELLASYFMRSKTGPWMPSDPTFISEGGRSELYYRPDSITWSGSKPLFNLTAAQDNSIGCPVFAQTHQWGYRDDTHGIGYSKTHDSLVTFGHAGLLFHGLADSLFDSCLSYPRCTMEWWRKEVVAPICAGRISPSGNDAAVLVRVEVEDGFVAYCSPWQGGFRDSLLAMYRVVAPDSLEPMWMSTGYPYTKAVCISGLILAFLDDSLCVVSRDDGHPLECLSTLPAGQLSWHYPYGDERVRLVAFNGDTVAVFRPEVSGIPTDVEPPAAGDALPHAFTLHEPYPNPFNATLSVPVTLDRAADLAVGVYNVLGQRVASLHEGPLGSGKHELTWDAHEVASGLYLVKATSGDRTATVKALLLK